jgi:hypothetical protein
MNDDTLKKIQKIMKELCLSPECCETHGKGTCICENCRQFYNVFGWEFLK